MLGESRTRLVDVATRRDVGNTAIQGLLVLVAMVLFSSVWWSLSAIEPGAVDGILFLLQSVVDVTLTMVAGLVGGLMGLSLSGFSAAMRLIRAKGRRILNRYLMCLSAAVILRLFSAYMAVSQGMVYSTFAIRSAIIVGVLGVSLSSAWTLYYRYMVWTDEDRLRHRTDSLLNREMAKGAAFRRMVGKSFHRDHLAFAYALALVLYALSLTVSIWLSEREGDASNEIVWSLPVCFILCISWGIFRRVFDVVRPWGERGSISPGEWDYVDGFKASDPEPVMSRKKSRSAKRSKTKRKR